MQGLTRLIGLRIPLLALSIGGMEDELASLRTQLAETNERLDFAERLLTRGEEGHRKP